VEETCVSWRCPSSSSSVISASCASVSPPRQRSLSRQALQGAVCLPRPSAVLQHTAAVCSRRPVVRVARRDMARPFSRGRTVCTVGSPCVVASQRKMMGDGHVMELRAFRLVGQQSEWVAGPAAIVTPPTQLNDAPQTDSQSRHARGCRQR
jgi:hypothetical protein